MSQPTRTTAALTATATATIALLAALTIAGCHSTTTGGSTQPTAAGNPTDAGDPTDAPTAGGCTPWPGLPYLRAVALPMLQLANDEVLYGPGSDQANSDALAVTVDQEGFSRIWPELPSPYAQEVQDDVLEINPDNASPEQLNAAAADAQSLAGSIGRLCPDS